MRDLVNSPFSYVLDDNYEIINKNRVVGYKSVKRRHVAAILRRSHRRKEPEPEIKQEEEDMEEDFQHHSALGDDLFDVSPMFDVS